jgi:murein DD-endopeptidase MepM/ murein hydrolase activator NlpD
VKDYTKAGRHFSRSAGRLLGVALCLLTLSAVAAGGTPPGPASAAPAAGYDFSDWHFPVPAGDWLISRGPCGGRGLYTHQCGYFEDECAFDLTPLTGSMMSVPVLAPQAGQVFFLGTRTDSGLAVLLRHADGRVSAMYHLSKVVVGLDQTVTQGQVIGYAGDTGSSSRPHVHFDVQPNAVERTCLPLYGIDEVNARLMTLHSDNLAWSDLILPDPPPSLPNWLPLPGTEAQSQAVVLPQRVELAPGAQVTVPVAINASYLGTQAVYFDGQRLAPGGAASGYVLFKITLTAPATPGDYQGSLEFRVAGPVSGALPATLDYTVREPMDSRPGAGLVWINPRPISPPNYALLASVPRLCVSEPAVAGPAPFSFRIMVSGQAQADSGWMADPCWTPPALPSGTYYWKAFVRDGQGHMNRTNDRPRVFKLQ